jgi:hypothetical protein
MHLADLASYLEADDKLARCTRTRKPGRAGDLNVASSGKFSSDRTIAEYAAEHLARQGVPGAVMEPRCARRERPAGIPRWPANRPRCHSGRPDSARAGVLRAQAEMDDPAQLVSFGTSGHRGSPLHGSFTEAHIAGDHAGHLRLPPRSAHRRPLYMGKDTHALSEPAQRTALEVLAANGVETIIQRDGASRRRRSSRGPSSCYNRGRAATSPTASWSRRRTTRPRTAASSTTRPTAVPPIPMSRVGSARANELLRRAAWA